MEDGWAERLRAEIERDGRSLRLISQTAGLGPNYVQQMLKDEKEPGADKLARLLDVLGGESALYILTGVRASSDDLAFLRAVERMTPETKRKARELFETLAGGPVRQEQ